jgi:hypothetical protein
LQWLRATLDDHDIWGLAGAVVGAVGVWMATVADITNSWLLLATAVALIADLCTDFAPPLSDLAYKLSVCTAASEADHHTLQYTNPATLSASAQVLFEHIQTKDGAWTDILSSNPVSALAARHCLGGRQKPLVAFIADVFLDLCADADADPMTLFTLEAACVERLRRGSPCMTLGSSILGQVRAMWETHVDPFWASMKP